MPNNSRAERYIYDPLTQKLVKVREKRGVDSASYCCPDENNVEPSDEINKSINDVHNDTINAQGWIGDNQEEELTASEENEEEMPSDKVTPLTFKAGGK